MGYLKIQCHNCGNTFDMYWEEINSKAKIHCPHCLAIMNKQRWDKLVDAYFTMEEVNKGLRNSHEQKREFLFQAEYRTHYVKPETYSADY